MIRFENLQHLSNDREVHMFLVVLIKKKSISDWLLDTEGFYFQKNDMYLCHLRSRRNYLFIIKNIDEEFVMEMHLV